MRVTMIPKTFQLNPVLKYTDPEYELIFYDDDGCEVNIGLYKKDLIHLKEVIEYAEIHDS